MVERGAGGRGRTARAALPLAMLAVVLAAAPALAAPCGHGLRVADVTVAGEPVPLDPSLLRCPSSVHPNLASYIGELEGAFARYLGFYTALHEDLALAQQAFAAHCRRCEAAIAETGADGYGAVSLGTASAAGASRAEPSACADVASSCPSDAFCVDGYRSPSGVLECSLKAVDLRDACSLSESPGAEPCSASGELSAALAFMERNLLGRYPVIIARLRSLRGRVEASMRQGTMDGSAIRQAQAELGAILEEVNATSQPVGGMDIVEFQRSVSRAVGRLAAPVLREDVTTRRFSRPASMVRLVADEAAVAAYCLARSITPCEPVLAQVRSCCEAFDVSGCPAASDGAGGSVRASSAFCTAQRLCREESYGRQVTDANVDPWSPNLLRLVDTFGAASSSALFVNETRCLASAFLQPSPGDPCEAHCLACFATRRSHCHPQTGTCVCEVGVEWRRTREPCPASQRPEVEACCRRILGGLAGGLAAAAGHAGTCEVAELWGVTYDRCQSTSSSTGICCRRGLAEVPVDDACLEGGATCATACHEAALGDAGAERRCAAACEGADVSCEEACAGYDPERWRGCVEGCPDIAPAAVACVAGCRSAPDPLLCARLCRARAPSLEAAADLLLEGAASEVLVVGSSVSASLRLRNAGSEPFTGRVEYTLLELSDCRCGECPADRACECRCSERRTGVVASAPVGPVPAGAFAHHVSSPLVLDPGREGVFLRTVATVVDPAGAVVVQALGPIRAYTSRPETMALDAWFESGGRVARRVYPNARVQGRVVLSAGIAPLDVVLNVTAGGRTVSTTRRTLAAAEDRVELVTEPVEVREAWADLLLGLSLEARSGGRTVLSGPLAAGSAGSAACSLATLTTACRAAATAAGRTYPGAYAEVDRPRLGVVGARFLAGDAAVTRAEPGTAVRAELVLRNAARVPFTGTVEVAVVASPGDAVVATGGRSASGLVTGADLALVTTAFSVREGALYGIHLRARDEPGLAWADGPVETGLLPSARLAGGWEAVSGERSDIVQEIEAGECRLSVRCTGCLPSCVLSVDADACRAEQQGCGCTCSITRA